MRDKLVAMRGQQQVDGKLGRGGRVLDHVARPGHGEALLDERAEDVVDALAGQARLSRDLGGRERVTPDQRQIGLGLVAGESQTGELGD